MWGSRTYLMGVLNVTPDSFTGDGIYEDPNRALRAGLKLVQDGADLVDVGGESTRPGFTPVDDVEELRRVLPVIRGLADGGVAVSIDTRKASVASHALDAGAIMVNDVSGLADQAMAGVAAAFGAFLAIMHPCPVDIGEDPIPRIRADLAMRIESALAAGGSRDRIVLDPGLGFGKSWRINLRVMRDLADLRGLGAPILVAASRKETISRVLGVAPGDRQEGSLALAAVSIAHGADILRVHDVAATARLARTMDAIVRDR
jgi:dihydropteroate synthase